MTNVVCYKGHMNPVWSVQFSPLGYYFATASKSQIIISHGAKNRDLRCVLLPATEGAGCKTRLEP